MAPLVTPQVRRKTPHEVLQQASSTAPLAIEVYVAGGGSVKTRVGHVSAGSSEGPASAELRTRARLAVAQRTRTRCTGNARAPRAGHLARIVSLGALFFFQRSSGKEVPFARNMASRAASPRSQKACAPSRGPVIVLCDCDARREAANARWKREGQQKKADDLLALYSGINTATGKSTVEWTKLRRLASDVNTRTPFASNVTRGIEAHALAQLALLALSASSS